MEANQQLIPTGTESHSPLRWSPRMKHNKAIINGRVLSRNADGMNRYDYSPTCGITNSLNRATNNGKCNWAVRINTLKRWIRIGICQIRYAQQHQFCYSDWYNIGHGDYCISSKGYVYSHTDAKVNCKRISFEFKTGDLLQFEYDSIIGKMKVTKNNNQQYEITEKYAVCASLFNSGDSVELMD